VEIHAKEGKGSKEGFGERLLNQSVSVVVPLSLLCFGVSCVLFRCRVGCLTVFAHKIKKKKKRKKGKKERRKVKKETKKKRKGGTIKLPINEKEKKSKNPKKQPRASSRQKISK